MGPPLVSVITPVYNGEAHLSAAIESVLAQTYASLEYVIVDNRSTDRTAGIAAQYAERDARVRVCRNREFLPLLRNWNHALQQASPDAAYIKVLHADDLIMPECIERMVEVAERHARVSLVSSYVLKGARVTGAGFPFPDECRGGREVLRDTLLKRYYVFGSPSSILMRANAVRKRSRFYNEENLHADVEACFELLQDADFGFVHQVLSYTRMHGDTQTATRAERLESNILENDLALLTRFGPRLLSQGDYQRARSRALGQYYRRLAREPRRLFDPAFRTYHREHLRRLGLRISGPRLAAALGARAARLMAHPSQWAGRLRRRGYAP